jgi:two-component system OmpR family response regulator
MLISTFLLEDQTDVRDALMSGMERFAPVRFIGLADTEAAAKKWLSANDSQWELAIVDLFLAQGSGLNVLKDCQSRSSRQKVVVFTSYTEEHMLRRCRELGADAIFNKAHDVENLVNFCKRHAADLESTGEIGLITDAYRSAILSLQDSS